MGRVGGVRVTEDWLVEGGRGRGWCARAARDGNGASAASTSIGDDDDEATAALGEVALGLSEDRWRWVRITGFGERC